VKKDQIFEAIVGREGGFVNNPDDRGGPTRWGVTEKVARAHGYQGDMRELPRETALAIFDADYWTGPRFDQVHAVSERIAEELCDTGVNMGPGVQAKMLQRWLNVFNLKGVLYPELVADGQIGPRTLVALKAFLAKRDSEGEAVMVRALNCSQGGRYLELAEQREANEAFVYGWMLSRVEVA
jgi:lysozyme family protein